MGRRSCLACNDFTMPFGPVACDVREISRGKGMQCLLGGFARILILGLFCPIPWVKWEPHPRFKRSGMLTS